MRKIIHIDMDAFYASVEQRDDPRLRGKPIVVGGSPEGRGVVAAASYEARRFGVRSAMSARRALKLCPQLVFVRPDFERYRAASKLIRKILHEVSDRVEPLALDEAFVDVTTNKLNEPLATTIAKWLKAKIREKTSLPASAGVGPNKFLAKLACDWKKPDGLYVIPPERAIAFLDPLDVEKLWGVGPATAKKLREMGLKTIRDVRLTDSAALVKRIGRFGLFLQSLSRGEDHREVSTDRTAKSRGAETTFETDITTLAALRTPLRELCEDVARSKRPGRTVVLKLRYENFQTITRSRTLSAPIHAVQEIQAVAWDLLSKNTEAGKRSVRLIGVSLSGFDEPDLAQLALFRL